MAGKNTAVFGIYKSADQAERAVDSLISAGFPNANISVLLPDTRSTKEFAHQKATKAPEGTAAGVTAGGVIGGTIGVLAGVGALAIPGIGPLFGSHTNGAGRTELIMLMSPHVISNEADSRGLTTHIEQQFQTLLDNSTFAHPRTPSR